VTGVPDDIGMPPGWTIELDAAARRRDSGRVLVGGTPLRVITLSAAGAKWLDRAHAGAPLVATGRGRLLARRLCEAGLAHPRPPQGAGPTRDDLAVVIPVRDDAEGLRRTRASLGPGAHVVVVDDGSRDPHAVLRAGGDAAVIRHDTSRGPAAARNTGLSATDRPVVAFVDADVDLAAGCLELLLAHLDDPTVGAVAPRILTRAGDAPGTLARYDAVRSSLDLGPSPSLVRPGARVPYVPATVLVARRGVLLGEGGFDEDLRFGEDVDLVWRLHRAGSRIRYEPRAVARHPTRPTYPAWFRQRVAYGSSAAALATRHGGAMAPVAVSGWSALAWSAALLRRPVVAAGVLAGGTITLRTKLGAVRHPEREAARIVVEGNLAAGRQLAAALWRPWLPITAAVALRSRRARWALVGSQLLPAALEWRARRPGIGFARFAALRALDDAAYASGVWLGCVRERSPEALIPETPRRRAARSRT
jgi:mycofactocin system glycosyltransferase